MNNKIKDFEKQISELNKLVVNGLVNGLSHTHRDGRTENIDFWIRRSRLFNSFSLCVMNIITNQSYELNEKELKEIAEEGYGNIK